MIKIDKNIEIPITKEDGLKALLKLKVGESISVKRDPLTVRVWAAELKNIAKNEVANKSGLKITKEHRDYVFVIRREMDRTRIWRKK